MTTRKSTKKAASTKKTVAKKTTAKKSVAKKITPKDSFTAILEQYVKLTAIDPKSMTRAELTTALKSNNAKFKRAIAKL